MAAAGENWLEAVLAEQPRVAVFDCDGTLWSPDAGYGFMRWSQAEGLVSRQASDWLDERYRAYCAGTVDEATICGEMVQVYAGLRESELRRAAGQFVRDAVLPHIFPEMRTLVERLRAAGTDIWAVSSTNNWIIEAGVGERFGIAPDRVLAARVAIVGALVTEKLLAVPTDEAKAQALRGAGLSQPDAVFGNSIHDYAMLAIARRAYPVNPTRALLERAETAGWPIFWPAGCPAAAIR